MLDSRLELGGATLVAVDLLLLVVVYVAVFVCRAVEDGG